MKSGGAGPVPAAVRLSTLLDDVIRGGEQEVSLQEVVDRTGGRGGYLLLVFLCLPFTTPIPLPGVSTVLGFMIAWIALGGLTRNPGGQRLPAWLGRRRIPVEGQRRVLQFSRKFVGWIERMAKPRGGGWMLGALGRRAHALLLAGLAALLMLPLPVPFTNSIPGYAIIFVSVSLMERDGRLIFVGYALSLAAVVYIGAALLGGLGALGSMWNWILPNAPATP